jgi:hypothetical protein
VNLNTQALSTPKEAMGYNAHRTKSAGNGSARRVDDVRELPRKLRLGQITALISAANWRR